MSPKPISLTLIVAATSTNGIGAFSALPWRLPKEMAYFARLTKGERPAPSSTGVPAGEARMNAVIMGRKTWEGIPDKFRPLKGRINVVVSRQVDYNLSSAPATYLSPSLPSCIPLLSPLSPPRIFLIGGSELYTHSLASSPLSSPYIADRILLTRLNADSSSYYQHKIDVWFPEIREGADGWKRASHKELEEWVGFEVPEGEQREVDRNDTLGREVGYEFQMWVR